MLRGHIKGNEAPKAMLGTLGRLMVAACAVGLIALGVAACDSDVGPDEPGTIEAALGWGGHGGHLGHVFGHHHKHHGPAQALRLNQIQVLGSHNSYKVSPHPAILALVSQLSQLLAWVIDYDHVPLGEQLDSWGVRQLELDVYADPEGGLYANRKALPLLGLPEASGEPELDEPGFKVQHILDFDFGTTCLTFVGCLEQVRDWSDDNPWHLPVLIMVETKSTSVPDEAEAAGVSVDGLPVAWTVPPQMTAELFEDLEAEILSVFDEGDLLMPDDVRRHKKTLEAAVLTRGWPQLFKLRGKVMFVLLNRGAPRDVYREGAPALQGRVMFTSSEPGQADAAFVRVDDPIGGAAEIAELVEAGYLVRTRADADTIEARFGDTTRRDAAFSSGAHFVSTDYYAEDPDLGTGYEVALPGGGVARCNPLNTHHACTLGY